MEDRKLGTVLAGAAAGAVNGLFAAGGGMVLVPLLTLLTDMEEEKVFPFSVATILPVCVVSLLLRWENIPGAIPDMIPYVIAAVPGSLLAEYTGKFIPVKWLHRGLGLLILWGGVRYLW